MPLSGEKIRIGSVIGLGIVGTALLGLGIYKNVSQEPSPPTQSFKTSASLTPTLAIPKGSTEMGGETLDEKVDELSRKTKEPSNVEADLQSTEEEESEIVFPEYELPPRFHKIVDIEDFEWTEPITPDEEIVKVVIPDGPNVLIKFEPILEEGHEIPPVEKPDVIEVAPREMGRKLPKPVEKRIIFNKSSLSTDASKSETINKPEKTTTTTKTPEINPKEAEMKKAEEEAEAQRLKEEEAKKAREQAEKDNNQAEADRLKAIEVAARKAKDDAERKAKKAAEAKEKEKKEKEEAAERKVKADEEEKKQKEEKAKKALELAAMNAEHERQLAARKVTDDKELLKRIQEKKKRDAKEEEERKEKEAARKAAKEAGKPLPPVTATQVKPPEKSAAEKTTEEVLHEGLRKIRARETDEEKDEEVW